MTKYYIDKEIAINALIDNFIFHSYVGEAAKKVIDKIPAADVRPNIRAKWEINCDGWYPYCSNCKQEPQGRIMTNFCPNCGADMERSNNDNTD